MTTKIASDLAIAFTTGFINSVFANPTSPKKPAQYFNNYFASGIVGGSIVAPFFFVREIITESAKQFPTEATRWGSLKKYVISNRGRHRNRYNDIQGAFRIRGAINGVMMAGVGYALHEYYSRSDKEHRTGD